MKAILISFLFLTSLSAWGNSEDLTCTRIELKKDFRIGGNGVQSVVDNEGISIQVNSLRSEGVYVSSGTELKFDAILSEFEFETVTRYTIPVGYIGNRENLPMPFTYEEFAGADCFYFRRGNQLYRKKVRDSHRVRAACSPTWNSVQAHISERRDVDVTQTKVVQFKNDDIEHRIECKKPESCDIKALGTGFFAKFSSPVRAVNSSSCGEDSSQEIVDEESIEASNQSAS